MGDNVSLDNRCLKLREKLFVDAATTCGKRMALISYLSFIKILYSLFVCFGF